ncbi:MAG: peptidoglycan editing factor PgeF [Hyphomicrobium sp.]|nr:peptidoglycan editing factor PgeF [Hyphomicrobium sp.]
MLQPITASNLAALDGIRHGFFTRPGGVSDGIYAGLNCGLGSSDDAERVLENRRRISDALGGTYGAVVTLYQEHGTTALAINAPADSNLPKADAVVTSTPGLVIGVLTADCGPLLFADSEAKIVAAAHAGWRGAVGGIIESTLAEMERIGAKRSRIAAALGPCISQAAYEVGAEFEAGVLERDPTSGPFFAMSAAAAKPHFDLPGYILSRLQTAGVTNIVNEARCTHADESLFFSYRRTTQRKEPDYGRQISAIVVA